MSPVAVFSSGKMNTECPRCHYSMDAFTGIAINAIPMPRENDLIMCGKCGQMNKFDKDLKLIQAERGWEKDFPSEMLPVVKNMQKEIVRRGGQN